MLKVAFGKEKMGRELSDRKVLRELGAGLQTVCSVNIAISKSVI